MRVILIKGRSAYGALRLFIDEVAAAFSRAGVEPAVIDATVEPDLATALRREAAGGAELAFSFNILGDFTDQGQCVTEIVGAPHVIHYVDYPLTHWPALDATSSKAALLCVDRTHPVTIRSIYGADRFAYVGFCPHAAIGQTVSPGADPDAFAQARPIPILFAGTFYRRATPHWSDMTQAAQRVFEAAYEVARACEGLPALGALDTVLEQMGVEPADPRYAPLRKGATFVHEQLRFHRRLELLQAADRLGVQLHVCGSGYEAALTEFSNLVHHGEPSLQDTLGLMAQARVVLNINANFSAGSHERVFSAMNAGAAVASDRSSFYAAAFLPGREIALYDWDDLDAGLVAVEALSRDPVAAHAMACAGQRRVLAEHRWDHRVGVILDAARQARARRAA
jgi:hypothetical protein